MSAATVVLFIFVSHGPSARPPDGVVAACVRALPDGGRPVVRAAPEAPADEAVAADAAAAGAVAAVVVSWEDPSQLAAQVRLVTGLPAHARWVSRQIAFDPADQPAERDRALGLVIASMIDEGIEAQPAPPPPPPVAGPPPAAPPPASVQERVASPGPPGLRWALEADVTTSYEAGANLDDTIGGAVGLRRALPHSLSVRAGLMFRLTERDGPDIRTSAQMAALGFAWAASRSDRAWALGFGLRADLLAIRESVRYVQDGVQGADEQSFRSFGADLVAETSLGLSAETALLLGVGGEATFTAADLKLGDELAATLPWLRLVMQLGVLARF